MSWAEFHITTTSRDANTLGDQLTLLGALAVTFQDAGDQPIYEPEPGTNKLWHETIVIGLFEQNHKSDLVIHYLEQQKKSGYLRHFELKHLENQDWERTCLAYYKPLKFGKRLWVCPSWETPPDQTAVNVLLDPGHAFGTGSHATTALCLEWLEQNITNQNTVIDYGCGSGILGIAALKLGAAQVYAVDHDPQALEATRKNLQLNHDVESKMKIFLSTEFDIQAPVDLIIANILAQPLLELAPCFAKLTHTGSKIALSGILSNQINDLKIAYAPWFELTETIDPTGEWARLGGYRR